MLFPGVKAEIISEVDMKMKKKAQICRDYNISSGTLNTSLKFKEALKHNPKDPIHFIHKQGM